MQKILSIERREDGVYGFYSAEYPGEDYKISKHGSVDEALQFYAAAAGETLVVITSADPDVLSCRHAAFTAESLGYQQTLFTDYLEAATYYRLAFSKSIAMTDFAVLHQYGNRLRMIHGRANIGVRTTVDVSEEILDIEIAPDATAAEKDDILYSFAESHLTPEIRLFYFTGDAFRDGFMNRSLGVLCSGRRVYQESNLFIFGGFAYAKLRYDEELNRRYAIHTTAMAGEIVEVPVETRAGGTCRSLVQPQTRLFDPEPGFAVLTQTASVIPVFHKDTDGTMIRKMDIPVAHMVRGLSKPTRLRLYADFTADGREVRVTVEDEGFGRFLKSGGMRVTCRMERKGAGVCGNS
ncbi:MAG: DUF5716 family protein [Eubacteriales bacterium]|nr:DUF5716 family protein [Eubacteriales bacterium]